MLRHHVPLKPISRSPLCTRTRPRRERLSWGSPRTAPITAKGGSEESGLSSSQSSIDLEDEDDDDERDIHVRTSGERHLKFVGEGLLQHSNRVRTPGPDFIGQHCNIQSKFRRSSQNTDDDPTDGASFSTGRTTNSHCDKTTNTNCTRSIIDNQTFTKTNPEQRGDTMNLHKDTVNNEMTFRSKSKEERNRLGHSTELETENNCRIFNMHNEQSETAANSERNSKRHEGTEVDETIFSKGDVKLNTSTVEGRTVLFTTVVNLPQSDMKPKRDERLPRALKPVRSKQRRTSTSSEPRANILTSQDSFNILAHKDRSILNRKSKSSQKYSSPSTQVKEKTRKSPELGVDKAPKVKSKLKSVKVPHCNTGSLLPRNRANDDAQSKRANPDKLSCSRAPQHTPVKELNKPGLVGTPRSKSAVDFITYKDMFQEIQSRDDGPVIYEMFAGPIYDNLRVSSSCEKVKSRQVQSARVRQRPVKPLLNRLKSPGERMVVSTKTKPKPVSSKVKPHLAPILRKSTQKMRAPPKLDGYKETELLLSEDVGACPNSAQEKADDRMLSIIEEVLSTYGSETLKSDKTLTIAAASNDTQIHKSFKEKNESSSTGNPKRLVPETVFPQSRQQPKINTWTSSSNSSSNNTGMSPVYRRFLNEVGDGPLTDELLQCLAEELISLDERDASMGQSPENLESSKEASSRDDELESRGPFPEVNFSQPVVMAMMADCGSEGRLFDPSLVQPTCQSLFGQDTDTDDSDDVSSAGNVCK